MLRVTDARVEKWVDKHFSCYGGKQCENWGQGNPKHMSGCPAKLKHRAFSLAYEILRAVDKKPAVRMRTAKARG